MTSQLVVFNHITNWPVPLISRNRLLTMPHVNLDLRFDHYPDIAAESARRARFEAQFAKDFDKAFDDVSKHEFAGLQREVDTIEADLLRRRNDPAAKYTAEMLGRDLDALNRKLKHDVEVWKGKVVALANKAFGHAVDTVDKENRANVRREAKHAVITVVVVAVICVSAAVLATVFTGGGALAIGLGIAAGLLPAIVQGARDYGPLREAYRSELKTLDAKKAEVDDAIKTVKKRLAEAAAKHVEKGSAASKELDKAAADLDKRLSQLYEHRIALQVKARKALQGAGKALDQLHGAKGGSPEAIHLIASSVQLAQRADALNAKVDDLRELKATADRTLDEVKAMKDPSWDRLRASLARLGAPEMNPLLERIGKELDAMGRLAKASA